MLGSVAGSPEASVLQPGEKAVAAAYALYSSATMIVLSLGSGTFGFTLDPELGEFVLTHEIRIPQKGEFCHQPTVTFACHAFQKELRSDSI